MSIDIGARLRAVRQRHGLSQRELARRAGLTNGLVSLIEMNRVSPSVSSLKKLLEGVPMALGEFFSDEWSATAPAPQVFYAADELLEVGDAQRSRRLLAAARASRALSILHERYQPGSENEGTQAGAGEQGGFVIRGRLELTVGGTTRVLGPGDAFYFSNSSPHRLRNVGQGVCEFISASTVAGVEYARSSARSASVQTR